MATGEGEEKIHVLEAAGAIGICTNLADMMMIETIGVGATASPLVTLLDSDEGFAPAVSAKMEVVKVGGDGEQLSEPVEVVVVVGGEVI